MSTDTAAKPMSAEERAGEQRGYRIGRRQGLEDAAQTVLTFDLDGLEAEIACQIRNLANSSEPGEDA